MNEIRSIDNIEEAFRWGDSAYKGEGFDYWSIINNKWICYGSKGKKASKRDSMGISL